MNNNIILKALETELKRQESLLKDVTEKIDYNPISAINEKYREIGSLKQSDPAQNRRVVDILNEITAIRKSLCNHSNRLAKCVEKKFDYEHNIINLKNAIISEKLKMEDPMGHFVMVTFNGNPLAKIKVEKEGK